MGNGRIRRRVAWLFGLLLVVAALDGFVYLRQQDSLKWSVLQAQATRFDPPAGWKWVGQAKLGSYNCLAACDSPNITLVYRTTASGAAACDQLRATIAGQLGAIKAAPLALGCGWQARAPAVGVDAYVRAGARPAGDLVGPSAPAWTSKIRPTGGDTLAWVEFNAGLG